jgi:iron(III) transport system substrate-binding protein
MSESEKSKQDRWFKDMILYGMLKSPLPIIAVIAILAAMLLPLLSRIKVSFQKNDLVVYAAQDQVFAEPILGEFTKQTAINVRAVYDSEAVKTVGLANRLMAERSHPRCDVFWGNEELRTRQLAEQGMFRQTNGWATFGYRSRRIVVNTNLVAAGVPPAVEGGILPPGSASERSPAPKPLTLKSPGGTPVATSVLDLTNTVWRGKVALAYPLFGTTATHFLALRQHWGESNWLAWCRALAANRPFLVDGNSVVVQFVARGDAWIGLTDSDDIAAAQSEGKPLAALPLTGESLLIPNTVAVVRGAPHPAAAQKLFEYLQRPEVAEKLRAAAALEGRSASEVATPTLKPDWEALLRDLDATTMTLKHIFLR